MNLIDTHTHLYLPDFKDDLELLLKQASQKSIHTFFLPNIDLESINSMIEIEQRFPGQCYSMMGLHPCSVKDDYKYVLTEIESWLQKRKFIAIGETGLDYYWDVSFKEEQKKAFQQQIEWALHYNIPIVIHSRNSIEDCIEVIKANQNGKLKGVFHCFSGGVEYAKQIIDLGFYMGIGGVITYKNSGLAETIETIDLNYILLETDAPYLTPVPFRGKRNEPAYILYVAEKIASIKNISIKEVADITSANAKKLFGS